MAKRRLLPAVFAGTITVIMFGNCVSGPRSPPFHGMDPAPPQVQPIVDNRPETPGRPEGSPVDPHEERE